MGKTTNTFFNRIIILFGCLILIIVPGCILYPQIAGIPLYPQTASIPLIERKGELQADGGVSLVPCINGTISYSPTDKIAIQAYGSAIEDIYYYQGTIGHYWKNSKKVILETYGGYGFGYSDAYKDSNMGHLRGNYNIYFLQFNIGKRNRKFSYFDDAGAGLKAGIVDSRLNSFNYYDEYFGEDIINVKSIPYHDYSLLIEPNVFLRVGGERLKLNLKLSGCWVKKITHTDKFLPYSPINMGISIYYLIVK